MSSHGSEALWRGVDEVIDRARTVEDLRAHRLHLLAAQRWRQQRRAVPDNLIDELMRSAWIRAGVQTVLQQVRDAYDGRIIVLKGPHTAGFYPAPYLRPFTDLDILAEDPEATHAALIAAGFSPIGHPDDYYRGLHHLQPLLAPHASVSVEIHRRPNWFYWGDPPPSDELLAVSEPGFIEIDGVLGLPAEHHALVLAAHAWAELPLRRLSDLLDVAAVTRTADRAAIGAIARRWGMDRVWRTTIAAADAMFLGDATPTSMKIWARNFPAVRDRTVQETHLRRILSTFWALPPIPAAAMTGVALVNTVLPAPSDAWSTKLARSRKAISHRSQPAAQHVELLGPEGRRPPRFRRR